MFANDKLQFYFVNIRLIISWLTWRHFGRMWLIAKTAHFANQLTPHLIGRWLWNAVNISPMRHFGSAKIGLGNALAKIEFCFDFVVLVFFESGKDGHVDLNHIIGTVATPCHFTKLDPGIGIFSKVKICIF